MSFSDMMSSSRGPGVIGMVFALVILLGFGVLFMFAFDEGMQGGDQSIESVIRTQAKDIAAYEKIIPEKQNVLHQIPAMVAAGKEVNRIKLSNHALQAKIIGLKESIVATNAELEETDAMFRAYKDQYRSYVRGNAKGTTMPILATTKSVVYKNVDIREVTAVGIQIRHDDGQKRIPFEELPDDMKDFYQFDPQQKEAAVAAELAQREVHDVQANAANEMSAEKLSEQREAAKAMEREKISQTIQTKESQLRGMNNELTQLDKELDRANSEASAARRTGRMVLSKAGNIKNRISRKKSQMSTLEAEIAQLRTRL